jgi:hypothetical protein
MFGKEKTKKRLEKMLKGWNINVEGKYKKLKKYLMDKIDILEKMREIAGISDSERLEKLDMEWNLRNMVAEEGIKRKQIARDRFINEGDENTRYFHLIAKGKKKKS